MTTETTQTAEPTTTTTPTEPKALSEKAMARKTAEAALRQQKVDYKTAGATIKVLAKTSPKKAGSKARLVWDMYQDGLTVTKLLEQADTNGLKSYAQACIVWDVRHGHIALEVPAVVTGPAAAPVAEAAAAPVAEAAAAQ